MSEGFIRTSYNRSNAASIVSDSVEYARTMERIHQYAYFRSNVHPYSDRERRIYTALIDQAGVAIDNRLLIEQTEHRSGTQRKTVCL